ncbi:MAG: hypothetical protein HYV16_08660 [Gammaproteobacteria bacterium]|nr:hypothetical protein [Gammaproteobacteria bacterium]
MSPLKRPPLEWVLAAGFIVAAGLYAVHERAQTRAEAELDRQREACLQRLALDEAPAEKDQLACRALYRELGIAKPLPKPL